MIRLNFDERHGGTTIDLGNGPVALAMPPFRVWSEWSIDWEQQAAAITEAGVLVYRATGEVARVGDVPWEDSRFHPHVVELNRRILTTVGAPLPTDDRYDLALGDRLMTAALLTHWRDHPLSPWDPDRVPDPTERSTDKRKIIRSNIRGVRGAISVIYRALYRHSPAVLDSLELWQIASLLGRDDPDELEADDPTLPGGKSRFDSRGNRSSTSFRRHPRQRLLFARPASVTLPADAVRPLNF